MKNTFDKVVSVGCSFGKDLNFIDINGKSLHENMKFLYPQLVADKLNAECINLSKSGIDNEYIIHTTLDYAQNNDNKNTLYLIQFTYMWRLGFPTISIETAPSWARESLGQLMQVTDMEKVDWTSLRPISDSMGVPDHDKFYETYIKYFYHEDICLKILLQKINLLKTWFEFHNISYKFLTTAQWNYGYHKAHNPGRDFKYDIARIIRDTIRLDGKKRKSLPFITNEIDKILSKPKDKNDKKFIEFCSNNNFVEFTKDLFYIDYWATLNKLNTSSDVHLTKEGHGILSNLILEKYYNEL